MTSVDTNIGIYKKFKKQNEFTPTPTTPPIPESEAKLSYLLRGNVVDDVPLLQPADFVKEKKPLRVYVSSLLRTWETAFLLFLSFLINSTDPDPEYIPVLVLVVSPFLREEEKSVVGIKGINASNEPGKIFDNIMQFLKFIDLYILLSNNSVPEVNAPFDRDPKKFNIVVEFSPTQKLYIHIDRTRPDNIIFDYDLSDTGIDDGKKDEIITYVNQIVPLTQDNISFIKTTITDTSTAYNGVDLTNIPPTHYNSFTINAATQVNLPYTLTEMDESQFDSFDTFSNYFPDIFNYLKWVISVKKHPKNIPIFAVCHSGTMQNFLNKIFYYFNLPTNGIKPSGSFIKTYEYCTKTNLWSFTLSYMGYSVIIFRHGFTCDNMYEKAGFFKTGDRIGGYYTHLSMWGIYSVKLFCEKNYSILTNITGIRDSILTIRPGFPKQPKDKIVGKNLPNEITCGDYNEGKSLRFNKNIPVTESSNVVTASRNSTNLKKSIQLTHVKSVVDSDIDKSIYELISIEFTDCPNTGSQFLGKTFGSTFGCIKLSCVYNGRYVIIRPYLHKTNGSTMYKISFYDTSNDENKGLVETKEVKIDSRLKNILEYEKMLVFLFNYDSGTSLTSIVTNFNISGVVHILMNTTMPRVIQILKTSTNAKIDVPDYIYSM
jgi:hypothetical protein